MDRRRKLLANQYEATAHAAIQKVVEGSECGVYPKVRVSDAVDIDRSGLSNEVFSYALKAHFDFVIADKSSRVRFAVEFDGPTHDTPEGRRKDAWKNEICERLGLPLLRVTASYLAEENESMSLLSWLTELWFKFEGFLDAQESGAIPRDEPFGYAFSSFDYFLRYRTSLWAAHRVGKLKSPPIAYVHTFDPSISRFVAAHFLHVPNDSFVVGEASCSQNELFPIEGDELASELATVEAFNKLVRLQYGNYHPLTRDEAKACYSRYTNLINSSGMKYGFGCGPFPNK